MALPLYVQEKLHYFRVLGGLFLSNAIIYTILFVWPNDSLQRIVGFWTLGVVSIIFYYGVYIAAEKLYGRFHEERALAAMEADGGQHKHHHDKIHHQHQTPPQQQQQPANNNVYVTVPSAPQPVYGQPYVVQQPQPMIQYPQIYQQPQPRYIPGGATAGGGANITIIPKRKTMNSS
jgi:hypothetical protein